MNKFKSMLMLIAMLGLSTAFAQDTPADNMEILKDKVRADKKLVVAANMGLTESEAQAFWPVYDAYQQELEAINKRVGKLIESYAANYREGTMTDDIAATLIEEMLAIEQAEADLRSSFVPKLSAALPATKVARYLQIENKIRAAISYDLSAAVPLVE
jgi:hypothetical protein